MIRRRVFSIVYMFLLTFFFTGVVTGVYEVNRDRIVLNEEIKLEEVVLRVFGMKFEAGTDKRRIRETFNKRIKVEHKEGRILYRGFEADGRSLVGYAFPLFGAGFWGPIYGIMAVDPNLERVIGVAFYRHSETPGLGGRITEAWFQEQFAGKILGPVGEGRRYFSLVPPGTSKAENELDAITGATGTSRAVERLINENLRDYLPWIARLRSNGEI